MSMNRPLSNFRSRYRTHTNQTSLPYGQVALVFLLLIAAVLIFAPRHSLSAPSLHDTVSSHSQTVTQFSFAVTADQRYYTGSNYHTSDYYRGALEALKAQGKGAFMISPGDIDPPGDSRWTIDKVLGTDYMWYPVVGNHEASTSSDMQYLRDYNYDSNGSGVEPDIVKTGPSGCPETTYSFDYGNAHFAVINEYCDENGDTELDGDVSDHVYNWLKEDLEATTKTHIFVIGHEPAYPKPDADTGDSRHVGDSLDKYTAHRDRFWNLLKSEGVVAYIVGHTHKYSAVKIDGVWQVDAGHARGKGDTDAPSTFLIFTINGNEVTLKAYRDNHDGDYDYDDIIHTETLKYDGPTPTPTATPTVPPSDTLDVRVSNGNDDVEERESDGRMYFDSSDLELVDDPNYQGDQTVGIRFQNLTIPQGATITSAYIEFETDETSSESTSLTFHGEDVDNAAAFSSTAHDLTNRTTTSASVDWNNIPAWNRVNEKHQSPDLSSIVQEIVNRSGWRSGNSMVFIITGSGRRVAESYDGESAAAPLLHVSYTTSSATSTPTSVPTDTPTPAPTATPVPTNTPTPIPTATPTATAVPTNTPTATSTPTSVPPTATPTATVVPTNTPSPTATPAPTATPTPTPTTTPSGPNLVTGTVVSDSDWKSVTLPSSYNSMVVVASVNYDSSADPAVVRIRNASGNSFEFRVENVQNGNAVSGVPVHYMVVEEGVYNENDHGVKMEAVKYTSTVTDENNSWVGESRSYSNSYTTPVVLGQVMTYNDADWSVFWARGASRKDPPSSSALYVGKHVGEDPDNTRADEVIGYIVIEAGSGSINGKRYVAALGADSIRGMGNRPPYSYALSGLNSASVAIVSSAGMDGINGGWPVLYGSSPLSTSSLKLAIDEDTINDSERKHISEQVAYIVFE